MKFIQYIFSALLLAGCLAMSLADTLEGKIVDAATGGPVSGVNIIQVNSPNGTISDGKGKFKLSVNKSADILLQVTDPGYLRERIIVSANKANKKRIIVNLRPSILPGNSIIMTSPINS